MNIKERVETVINDMRIKNQYDLSLERIEHYVKYYTEITREDVINFIIGEIDYTEDNCFDEELKEYICDTFRTFLCRF